MEGIVLAHGDATADVGWLLPVLVLAVPASLYAAGVVRVRRAGRSWSPWRGGFFLVGLGLVAAALSPPLEAFAGDARGHMVQHLLLGMFGPIAVVLAAPLTLFLAAAPMAWRRPVAAVLRARWVHVLSHVTTAAVLSVGGLYVLYLTPLYALAVGSEAVHHLVHVHFLLAGYLFAWAVAGPDPAPRRPGMAVRIAVLIVAGGAHSFLAKLLYSRAPTLPPGGGHGVEELESAAQWMYYGGHLADLLLMVALFAGWYRRAGRRIERGQRSPDLHGELLTATGANVQRTVSGSAVRGRSHAAADARGEGAGLELASR